MATDSKEEIKIKHGENCVFTLLLGKANHFREGKEKSLERERDVPVKVKWF